MRERERSSPFYAAGRGGAGEEKVWISLERKGNIDAITKRRVYAREKTRRILIKVERRGACFVLLPFSARFVYST